MSASSTSRPRSAPSVLVDLADRGLILILDLRFVITT
jgi:hypothetical protein